MNDLEQRLNDIEVKYSYQEQFIQELNKTVIQQQSKIEEITEYLKELQRPSGNDQNTSLKNERPPHY